MGFSFDGALCLRSREKILSARASFLLRSRPAVAKQESVIGVGRERVSWIRWGLPSLMIFWKSEAAGAMVSALLLPVVDGGEATKVGMSKRMSMGCDLQTGRLRREALTLDINVAP